MNFCRIYEVEYKDAINKKKTQLLNNSSNFESLKFFLNNNLSLKNEFGVFIPLTFIEKTLIINQVIEELKKLEITSEVETKINNLNELKSELKKARNFSPFKVVTTDKNLRALLTSVDYRNYFAMDFLHSNALIPALSPSLNAKLFTEIRNEINQKTFWDPTASKPTVIIDSDELNNSLNGYKQYLLDKLFDWLQENNSSEAATQGLPQHLIISNTTNFLELYKKAMQLIWKTISNKIRTSSNNQTFLDCLDSVEKRNQIINAVKNFYILQNFDECIEAFSGGTVTYNKDLHYINSNEDKYILRRQVNKVGSFADSYSDIDSEPTTSFILKQFISTLQLADGSYIGPGFLQRLSLGIKDILENLGESQANDLRFLYENNSVEAQIQKLLAYLKDDLRSTTLRRRFKGQNELVVFADSLERYAEAIENSNISNWKKLAEFRNTHNLCSALIDAIKNKMAMSYNSINEKGETETLSSVDHSNSKQMIINLLENAIKETISSGQLYLYNPNFLVASELTWKSLDKVYSLNTIKLIQKITGIDLNNTTLKEIFSTGENLTKLCQFLKDFTSLVYKKFEGISALDTEGINRITEEVIKTLKYESGSYLDFSNAYIGKNTSIAEKILDQKGNASPIEGQNTTIANIAKNKFRYEELLKKIFNDDVIQTQKYLRKNILFSTEKRDLLSKSVDVWGNKETAKSSGYSAHIVLALDIQIAPGVVIKPTDLSVAEQASFAVCSDYLYNIVKYNYMLTQLECYSDKVRIAKGAYNFLDSADKGATSQNSLHRNSISGIQDLAFEQHAAYYLAIEKDICNSLSELFSGAHITNILEAAAFLENHPSLRGKNADEIDHILAKEIAKHQRVHPDSDISFLRDIHYTFKKIGDNNWCASINSTLQYKIALAKDKKLFLAARQTGFDKFKKNLLKYGCKIPLGIQELFSLANNGENNVFANLSELEISNLRYLFTGDGKTPTDEQIATILSEGLTEYGTTAKDKKLNEIRDNFFRKYFELTNITREADLQVSLKPMWIHDKDSSSLIGTLDFTDLNDPKTIENIRKILNEESKKLTKGKKRMNAGPATFNSWLLGEKFGVPPKIRVATIEHAQLTSFNYFGNKETLNTHDGGIWSHSIMRTWERYSYPGHNVASSLKVIAINPYLAGQQQIKCADYEMTNTWIRESMDKKKLNNGEQFNGDILMYKMLNCAYLTNSFITNWVQSRLSLGEQRFYQTILGQDCYLKLEENKDGSINFNWYSLADNNLIKTDNIGIGSTVYDLWKALGGAYSKDIDESGNISFSNNSQETVALLISNFDPSLKEQIVCKLVDEEASKSSLGAKNGKDVITNKDDNYLASTFINTDNYGIQLDYSHHSDDSEIPALTQVITAIAFNGENTQLVAQEYEVLNLLTKNALRSFTDKWKDTENPKRFHYYMANELLRAIKSNSLSSNAELIIKNALQRISKGELITLPYSDLQLYYLATSLLLTKLNASTLRQSFKGVAVVQNPANGIVGVYEDHNGVTYTRTDIVNLANKWYLTNKHLVKGTDQEDIIESYLDNSDIFKPTTLRSFNLIGIGEYVYINGNYQKPFYIENPLELTKLYNWFKEGSITLEKAYNVERDLAVTKITWDEIGDGGNFWLLQSTQALLEENIKDKDYLYKYKDLTLELKTYWQKANLRGLKELNNPYYYNTFDDLVNDRKTIVSNVIYKGGEEILPKEYKTAMGLEDYSMSQIENEKENFFKRIVRERYLLDPSVNFDNYESFIGIAGTEFDVILTSNSIDHAESNTTIDEDGYIYDPYGIKIPGVQLPKEFRPYIKDGEEQGAVVVYEKEPGQNKGRLVIHHLGISKLSRGAVKNIMGHNANAYYFNDSEMSKKYGPLNSILNTSSPVSIETGLDLLAKNMYQSWKLTRETISARIPSQAYQSFLANKTVAYTDDDSNNGYMNIWEMWFQGSDYDIDKAYTMMYALDKRGRIAGNVFTDYTSPESIKESFLLPPPTANIIKEDSPEAANLFDPNVQNEILSKIIDSTSLTFATWDNLESYIDSLNKETLYKERINLLSKILKVIQNYPLLSFNKQVNDIEDSESEGSQPLYIPSLLKKLVNYQLGRESTEAMLNRIMHGIYTAASDLNNLKAAEVPMSMDPAINLIDKFNYIKSIVSYLRNFKLNPDQNILNNLLSYFNVTNLDSIESILYMQLPKQVEDTYKFISKELKDYGEELDSYNDLDPFTIWMIQKENAVGKKDVGISANAIKAAGSLQQYYNMADIKLDERIQAIKEVDPTITDTQILETLESSFAKNKLNVFLTFKSKPQLNGERRVIARDRIFRLANTKQSYDVFKLRLLAGYTNNPSNPNSLLINHPLYSIFSNEKIPNTLKEIKFKRILDFGIRMGKIQTTVNEKGEVIPIINQENFIKTLYFATNFEDNVADSISMFISLATDNAKTLKLSKMYGRPELLSLPLTMLTLGMNLDEVIDICVNLMDVIDEDLDTNRINNAKVSRDLKALIAKHVLSGEFDLETAFSLGFIVDISKELRCLTSFFKINQGAPSKLPELQAFLNSLSSYKLLAEKEHSLSTSTSNLIGKPIDFLKLFNSKDSITVDNTVSLFEKLKTGFNVIDVVLETPHFRSLLESVAETIDLIQHMSGVAYMVSKFTSLNNITEDTEVSGEVLSYILNPDNSLRTHDSEISYTRRLIKLVNLFLILKGILKMTDYQFSVAAATLVFGDWHTSLAPETILGITDAESTNAFLEFMDKQVIPTLIEKYSTNDFIKNLAIKNDKGRTGRNYYDLNLDSYDAAKDRAIADEINLAANAYEEIAYIPTGLKTASDSDITIGDLFYMYNLITSRNAIKGSTSCIYSYAAKHKNNLGECITHFVDDEFIKLDELVQTYREYDQQLDPNAKSVLSSYLTEFSKYEAALRNPDGTYTDEKNSTIYDIRKEFIATMDKGTYSLPISTQTMEEDLLTKLSYAYNNVNISLESVNGVNMLTIKATPRLLSTESLTKSYIVMDGDISRVIGYNYEAILNKRANEIIHDFTRASISLENQLKKLGFNGQFSTTSIEDFPNIQIPFDTIKTAFITDHNPRLEEIYNSVFTDNHLVIVNNEQKSAIYVDLAGQVPVIVVNPRLFTLKNPDSIYKEIFNAYFLLKQTYPISEYDKLINAVSLITDLVITKNNINELLKDPDILDAIKNSPKILKHYISDLQNPNTEYLRRKSSILLRRFSPILMNSGLRDFYYIKDPTDSIPEREGDLYVDYEAAIEKILELTGNKDITTVKEFREKNSKGEFKLTRELLSEINSLILEAQNLVYIRLSDIEDGKTIYAQLHGVNNLHKPIIKCRFTKSNHFKRIRHLRINPEYTFIEQEGILNSNWRSLPWSETSVPISSIVIGDIIQFSTDKGVLEVLIKDITPNENNSAFDIIYSPIKDDNITSYYGTMLNVSPSKSFIVKRSSKVVIPEITQSKGSVIESKALFSLTKELQKEITNKLLLGDTIVANINGLNIEFTFRGKKSDTKFLIYPKYVGEENIKEIDLSQVVELHFKNFAELDPSFSQLLQEKHVILTKGALMNEALYHPELLDGYIILNSEGKLLLWKDVESNENIKDNHYLLLLPAYHVGPNYYYQKYNLGDATRIGLFNGERYALEKDDLLIKYTQENSGKNVVPIQEIRKVLNIDGENITYLYMKNIIDYASIGTPKYMKEDNIETGLKTEPISKFKDYIQYRPAKQGSVKRVENASSNSSPTSLSYEGQKILEKLSRKFNTKIKFVKEPEEDYFAKVVNGEVIINTDNQKFNDYNEKLKELSNITITFDLYVAALAIHEFTHLMLAYCRAESPTLYWKLINTVKKSVSQFLSEVYTTDIAKTEETIVRSVENYIVQNLQLLNAGNIGEYINKGFNELFDTITNWPKDVRYKIDTVLPKYFFNDASIYADLVSIRNKYLNDLILEKIICD